MKNKNQLCNKYTISIQYIYGSEGVLKVTHGGLQVTMAT